MSIVGDLPWSNLKRRTVRAPVNPLDVSVVVSIYPKPITEIKPTIQPGRFHIEAGSYEKPALMKLGPSSWWKELDEDQPLLEIPVSSIQIADSFVKDYANGLLACNMSDCMPGLFYVAGGATLETIKKVYQAELDKAQVVQRNWYQALVKLGDILWARSNGNPLSISDDMRLAAQELNLKEKPWMIDFTTITLTNCKFCGTLVRPGFPICASCHHVVDVDLYNKMNPVKIDAK